MGGRAWRNVMLPLALLTMTPSVLAQARSWTISPSIGLRGTYTDNVSLSATPEGGEFVTTITPAISISGRGARLSASLNYAANANFYARNSERNHLANTLSASANLEAVENFFFIDAQASVSQNYISPFGVRPFDFITTTDNRTETRTASISPYLRGQFAGGHSYELRNRNTWTSTDDEALARVHTQQWSGSVASPIRLFGWALDASESSTSYEDGVERPELETRHVRGRLFFQPYSTLRLYASAGGEENNYTLQEERSYWTYGYGVLWQATPRTTAAFDWEHRFFGVARHASLSHRTRLSAWSVSYSRNVSTFQQQLLQLPPGNTAALLDAIFRARIPDPVARQAAVEEFMRVSGTPAFLANSLAFYTEQVFLNESVQGSFAILGARNSISFTAFASESSALTAPSAALPAELFPSAGSRVRQHGFGIGASHRLTPFTSVSANANRTFAQSLEPPGPESRNDHMSLSLNHTLSPRTNTFGGASYAKFESSAAPAAHARSVFAGLTHRF